MAASAHPGGSGFESGGAQHVAGGAAAVCGGPWAAQGAGLAARSAARAVRRVPLRALGGARLARPQCLQVRAAMPSAAPSHVSQGTAKELSCFPGSALDPFTRMRTTIFGITAAWNLIHLQLHAMKIHRFAPIPFISNVFSCTGTARDSSG